MKKISKVLKLKEDEKVIRVIRHYFFVVIPSLVVSTLIVFMDFFLMFYFFSLGWWGTVMFFSILFIAVFYIIRLLFLWNRNLIIVTNKRLIDLESSGFFKKLVTDFPFKKIKNVTLDVNGIIRRIFRYGDIKLDIEAQPLGFRLYNIKKPAEILELINMQIMQGTIAVKSSDLNFDEIAYEVGKLTLQEKKELAVILDNDLSNIEEEVEESEEDEL